MEQRGEEVPQGLHVAIIMDGNGRWARARGRPRLVGHRQGAKSVRRVVEAAPDLGIRVLTLYAFSADNWQRPAPEVAGLFRLFHRYLRTEIGECLERGVRLSVIGRRDRLPASLVAAIEAAESATREGQVLHLRLAVDYSSRDAILVAAQRLNGAPPTRQAFARVLAQATHAPLPAPDVDLLIRTAGEQRLSDFLLWENAYAELYFTPRLWPDFGASELEVAVREFHRRERRFGAIPEAAAV
ncbi:MAG: di-trans,poly-cis-decaprenylcistransferase [Gemmatimonadetes bacterium]|nr:di-trans,poly-cis-decaprenylcistransferase [Gemmatimonadota bacterium]